MYWKRVYEFVMWIAMFCLNQQFNIRISSQQIPGPSTVKLTTCHSMLLKIWQLMADKKLNIHRIQSFIYELGSVQQRNLYSASGV